jgi:hypothetical protein
MYIRFKSAHQPTTTTTTKIWTMDENFYVELDSVDYIELTSAKEPPSMLWILANVMVAEFETGIIPKQQGLNAVSMNVISIDQTRSSHRLKITLEALWRHNTNNYSDNSFQSTFVRV